jgi:hypothetical protein
VHPDIVVAQQTPRDGAFQPLERALISAVEAKRIQWTEAHQYDTDKKDGPVHDLASADSAAG